LRILVSGTHGFLAPPLISRLVSEGHQVDGLDKKLEYLGPKPVYEKFYRVDLSKLHEYPFILGDFKEYDLVYHLAANTNLTDTCYPHYRDNVQGTWNLLKYTDCPIVFTSSAAVYGEGRRLRELSCMKPDSPYGFTKATAERMVEVSGRDYTIFRPGTIVGEYGRTFPNTMIQCAIDNQGLELYNMGCNLRSIIDVRDVVEALVRRPLGTYNLGSREETRMLDLAKLVHQVGLECGLDFRYCPVERTTPGLAKQVTLYSGKLRRTGWKCKVSLVDTIRRMFEHHIGEKNED